MHVVIGEKYIVLKLSEGIWRRYFSGILPEQSIRYG